MPLRETYSAGAFVFTFIAMSMSQYKLPHYIFITLPWAAVLVARHLNREATNMRWQWAGLYFIITVGLLVAFLAPFFVFPTANMAIWGVLLAGTVWLAIQVFKNPFPADSDLLVQRGVWASILIGFVLNFHFYPQLLPYQSAKAVTQFARDKGIPPSKMAYFHRGGNALDFYNRDIVEDFEAYEAIRSHAKTTGAFWLHADDAGKGELEMNDVRFEVANTFPHFQVALLKARFLDPAQRAATLDTFYLLKILPEQN